MSSGNCAHASATDRTVLGAFGFLAVHVCVRYHILKVC